MASAGWQLIPRRGIARAGLEIFFGMLRADLRARLAAAFSPPNSQFPNEDDYRSSDGSWLRLRFAGEALQDVEFLQGELELDGLALHAGARWDALEAELETRGFEFRRSRQLGHGYECEELGVNIATHEQIGGDHGDDAVEWVIASASIA